MFERLIVNGFRILVAAVLLFCPLDISGQCGVYLKPALTQAFPHSMVYLDGAEDMTGDGRPDLLASQNHTPSVFERNRIFVIPNLGSGSLGAPIIISPPPGQMFFDSRYSAVLAGNVDGDPLKDLLTFYDNGAFRYIVAFTNNGNGSFSPRTLVNSSSMGTPVGLTDINNDGFDDYIGIFGSELRYSLGDGQGVFGQTGTITSDGQAVAGDFNGDGKKDFVNSRHLYLNQGNLTFAPLDIASVFPLGDAIIGIRDFNGDGRSDLVTAPGSESDRFSLLIATGTSFSRVDHVVSTEPNASGTSVVGNFAGDGSPDVVFTFRRRNQKVVFVNDGAGNLVRREYDQRFLKFNLLRTVIADFDSDGKDDLLQATSSIDGGRVMLRDVTSFTYLRNSCDRPGQSRIVDFVGLANTSYSFWDPATGDWWHRSNPYGAGDPIEAGTVNWGLGSFNDIPAPGDFDGDGVSDRAIYRDSTGVWYIRRSSDQSWFVMPFGLPGDKPIPADYDGDMVSDIAVWRPSDGDWYVWHMRTQQFLALHFGSEGDILVPADYDGDGKTDIAVFRPSTGVWYCRTGSNGEFSALQWGLSTDKPIPADYDGDGRADVAVYRPSQRGAYVLRSYSPAFTYYQFGVQGDMLQVGDYDGDFVADIGIYRPSTQTWWTTSNQFTAATLFGGTDVIPTSSVVRTDD